MKPVTLSLKNGEGAVKKILVRRTIEVYGEEAAVRRQLDQSWLKPEIPVTDGVREGVIIGVRQEEVERVEFEVDEGYAKKLEKDYEDRKRGKQP